MTLLAQAAEPSCYSRLTNEWFCVQYVVDRQDEIVEATDGQQALDVFERERPAVVVIDVVMPRLGGLETCRLLKSRTNRYLPVLMVSSRNSVQDRVNGLRAVSEAFEASEYEVVEPLTEFAPVPGMGWMFVADPDGNWIELFGVL